MANVQLNPHETQFVKDYVEQTVDILSMMLPQLTKTEISYAVQESIDAKIQNLPVMVDNSYKKTQIKTTLLELTQFIAMKKPIMTNQGVMFSNHVSNVLNPIAKMLAGFLSGRKKMKKMMFSFPKGTADFAKYNLLQLLMKLDANAYYGCSGQYSCIYYNLYAASSVTTQGKQANATAALFFEQFMANNVPFESLNELMVFIDNIRKDVWQFNANTLGLRHISTEDCFFKLLYNCGFDWIPSDHEMELVWKALSQLDQDTIDRIYYKNNLFEFVDNQYVIDLILTMLVKLQKPFLDPNSPPPEIEQEINHFHDLLHDFVYYAHQIPSKIEKMDNLIRDVSIIQDTDSCIISFDAWYRFILGKTNGIDMAIKHVETDAIDGDVVDVQFLEDYDFYNDEIIEVKRGVNPSHVIPEDGLRHSILSVLAYCTGRLVNENVEQMCCNFNAVKPDGCAVMLKTEFLFRRILTTDAKKHYASIQELQEGNVIPVEESLDVKGMEAFVKSTMNKKTQEQLKKILYEDILATPVIDQVNVMKKIAIVERRIFDSIHNGEKEYYKPAKIRSAASYDNPMFIQGVKASVAYNALHEPGTEAIDTTIRNSLDIIKVEMNRKNVGKIAESYPGVYERAMSLFDTNEYFKSGVDAVAIPMNEPVPEWVLPFIRYAEIINDNVGKFPLESIGMNRGAGSNNSTNIVQF